VEKNGLHNNSSKVMSWQITIVKDSKYTKDLWTTIKGIFLQSKHYCKVFKKLRIIFWCTCQKSNGYFQILW